MHMKHEHGDAHLCVCVGWRVIWGGGKPENIPRTQAASPEQMLKEGGSKCFIHPAEYSHVLNLIVTQGEVTRYPVDDNRINFSQIVRTVLL